MMVCEGFIKNFHTLEGVLLKEKKKSFHILLKSIEGSSPITLDIITRTLIPTSYLEETLKIEFLIHFKRTNDLLNILIDGNEIGASKIIRQGWFIQELMLKYTPVQFVDELFPKLSFSNRTKILKRLIVYVKDENKIQELFETLYRVYGFKVALCLLPGCATNKIKENLKKNSVHLSASQLKTLFDKDKSIITTYFEELKHDGRDVDDFKWRSFFDYMGIKDPLFYFETAEKFNIDKRKLGRKSTKKLIDLQRDRVINKPEEYLRFLRKDALVRKLGKDFPQFYKNALPKSISDFRFCFVKSYLRYYTKGKQYELYSNSFQDMYNENLWDNTDLMDQRLIEYISDKEERDKWISRFENRGNIKKYVLKKKCAKRSMVFQENGEKPIKEKKTIFNTLISTCKLTKDYHAFLNILKSFCERHKNSDVTILYNFLRTIYKELDMKKLTEEHWKYLYGIIAIQLFKKQQVFFPMFVEYIKFMFSQNKPIEEFVFTLMSELPRNLSSFKYDDVKFEEAMIRSYIDLLPKVNGEKNILAIQIALSVIKWNENHPEETISISHQKDILTSIAKLKDSETVEPNTMKVFKYLICRQGNNQEISNLDEIYWSNLKNLNNKTISQWFLKYKPIVLKQHLDKIGILIKGKNINFVRTLKKYDHIDIPHGITMLCLEELKNAEPSKRGLVIKILIYFMPLQELQTYFKQYIPQFDKTDISSGDDNIQKSYEIRCALAKYLKSTVNLKQFLPDLLKYCRGDVLKSALPSLYSSFCRIPENQLYFALEELSVGAVSVRKHEIFLSSLIIPSEKVLLKFKQIETIEKNSSVKQHMFLSCYKYFMNNNSPECWEILKNYISHIKTGQKDVLKILTNVDHIPKEYRAIFTELVWGTLIRLKKENVKMDDDMYSLLRNLRKNDILLLRDEFCIDLIESKLFDLDKCSIEEPVFEFSRQFFLYGGSVEKKIGFIFKLLHEFKKKFWGNDEKKMDALKVINQFCFGLFEDILGKDMEQFHRNFPKLFLDAWTKEFTIEETFEENLIINFVKLKFESDVSSQSLPEHTSKVFADSLKLYGNLIINSFKQFLTSFLHLVFKGDNYDLQLINFLNAFLEQNGSLQHCALVVDLLPGGYMDGETKQAYKKLIEKLLQRDQIVRIRVFGKLKSKYY